MGRRSVGIQQIPKKIPKRGSRPEQGNKPNEYEEKERCFRRVNTAFMGGTALFVWFAALAPVPVLLSCAPSILLLAVVFATPSNRNEKTSRGPKSASSSRISMICGEDSSAAVTRDRVTFALFCCMELQYLYLFIICNYEFRYLLPVHIIQVYTVFPQVLSSAFAFPRSSPSSALVWMVYTVLDPNTTVHNLEQQTTDTINTRDKRHVEFPSFRC